MDIKKHHLSKIKSLSAHLYGQMSLDSALSHAYCVNYWFCRWFRAKGILFLSLFSFSQRDRKCEKGKESLTHFLQPTLQLLYVFNLINVAMKYLVNTEQLHDETRNNRLTFVTQAPVHCSCQS